MEQKTPLYDCHVAAGGKMVPFAGYLLPVQYPTGVIGEHMAVRQKAGLFDVSHMGEVLLKGKDALANVQMLVTNDCSTMRDGQARYSPMCNDAGGVVDDLLVYRIREDCYYIVVNAANRMKDVMWMQDHLFGAVEFTDLSDAIAQLALQGPASSAILQKLAGPEAIPTKYYWFVTEGTVAGIKCLVSKTGYTGEDGFELYCAPEDAPKLWDALLEAGKEDGLIPCGLGARDTLRLEAAMPLYGHEMDEAVTPLETGLGFAVKMKKADFIGKKALEAHGPATRKRVGLTMVGRGIAREDCPVFVGEKQVGKTTSGTHCPYLNHAVAMALVDLSAAEIGTEVDVLVRGRRIAAKVVALPFYQK